MRRGRALSSIRKRMTTLNTIEGDRRSLQLLDLRRMAKVISLAALEDETVSERNGEAGG